MIDFAHLHVHSYYSVLDGMSSVAGLVEKIKNTGMRAIALTDHGNMFGIKEFFDTVSKVNEDIKDDHKKIKPILGVEAYVAHNSYKINNKSKERTKDDIGGWHLILLAKNETGYHNLCKLVSESYINGFYRNPRIDKELLKQYSEGLIVCSACLGGEIPQKLLGTAAKDVDEEEQAGDTGFEDSVHISEKNIDAAQEAVLWFKDVFGDDYYLEIQRLKTNKLDANREVYKLQKVVNVAILELARRTNTKIVATNDVHFIEEAHADAHDRLICLSTGKDLDDKNRMRYTKQEWLKTPEEMYEIFSDIPEALTNTMEIVDKVEFYSLKKDAMMPEFDIPVEFGAIEEYRAKYSEADLRKEFVTIEGEERFDKLGGYEKVLRIKLEADYLEKLTYDGAQKRYNPLTNDIKERIDFELNTMKTMGFPGYFLIVQDFIEQARKMDVAVGPGRGSAAGSVVAYCLKITNIDPLPYDLLFERFLNPDRISLPDIDIDFDDDGRAKVLQWVTDKYGKERVAHIVTYGTMAAKSSIKDVARVQKLPLSESNRLASFVPPKFDEDSTSGKAPKVNLKNCYKLIPEFKDELKSGSEEVKSVLKYAEILEGTVRQTGVHACGVIIGADDLSKFVPISTAKEKGTDEDILVTQYEGAIIEDVGLIKTDFLGLKTLNIITETLSIIKRNKNIDINIDNISLYDKKTYDLYSNGETVGTFQFESDGMRQHLKNLKPTKFEDLIAMNALYRPGPMDYIPNFINRKHGREKITYDFPIMENRLKDTYGICVYQEQVMLMSRDIAGFTRGQSDELRKAMGKKLIDKMAVLKTKFMDGAQRNGYTDKGKLEKVWNDWAAFAKYAFNKSHATCYSLVAYQTAFLKANYPAEYMAALLTRNLTDIKEVTKFMAECQRMGIQVLGPDVNESDLHFSVKENDTIRFGLGGIKNVGSKAVEAIIAERNNNGKFTDVYDFVARIDLKAVNKKAIESLAYAGAFDCFTNIQRPQYFTNVKNSPDTFLDALIAYGNNIKKHKDAGPSLFAANDNTAKIHSPKPLDVDNVNNLELLNKEKEYVGLFISAHPLDVAKFYYQYFNVTPLNKLEEKETALAKNFSVIGLVTAITHKSFDKYDKDGNPYLLNLMDISIMDYDGNYNFVMFNKDIDKFGHKIELNKPIFITASFNRGKGVNAGKTYFNVNNIINLYNPDFESFELKIDTKIINEEIANTINESLENKDEKGNTKLIITIYNREKELYFTLGSRNNFFINKNFVDFVSKNFTREYYRITI